MGLESDRRQAFDLANVFGWEGFEPSTFRLCIDGAVEVVRKRSTL
jgi:hypothetical protein